MLNPGLTVLPYSKHAYLEVNPNEIHKDQAVKVFVHLIQAVSLDVLYTLNNIKIGSLKLDKIWECGRCLIFVFWLMSHPGLMTILFLICN